MIKNVKVAGFAGVPYLESSALMKTHKGALTLSTKKPNVIVGPNGAGKSALLGALAIRFLAHITGVSRYNSAYTDSHKSGQFWSRSSSWGNDWAFLSGLLVNTDNAPAIYYRPSHIPGNEKCVTTAMMIGYMNEAKDYARMTERKSSGQQCQALLERLLVALSGEGLPSSYEGFGSADARAKRKEQLAGHTRYPWDYQSEVLIKTYADVEGGIPLLLLDEPEQSLDALAEAKLWKAIASADCSAMQIIVATHSLQPMLNPKQYNIISAVPGYVDEVRAAMGVATQ